MALIFTSSASYSTNNKPPVDIVLDLDGVILFKNYSDQTSPKKLIEVKGVTYRVAEHLDAFFNYLIHNLKARITFFSDASNDRNLEALKLIRLANGQTLLSLATDSTQNQIRVFGKDSVTYVDGPSNRHKELSSLPVNFLLSQTLLIDDQEGNARGKQRANLVSAFDGTGGLPYPAAHDFSSPPDYFDAEDLKELAFIENELLRLTWVIDQTSKIASQQKISLLEALENVQRVQPISQYNGTGVPQLKGELFLPAVYEQGAKLLSLNQNNSSLSCLRTVD